MTKVSNEVAIVVVTYNRKILLKECIRALLNQDYDNYKILIIDNASSDGTKDYIKNELKEKKVYYENTGANIGGAGGFNYGMKRAYELGCDYMWLMDDDCIVKKDSLKKLLEADKILNGNYGFLSSKVLWTDNTLCNMNKQKFTKDFKKNKFLCEKGLLKTYYASFVSFFIKKEVVEEVGLPIKDFFIWGDDIEYSNRISKKYDNYMVDNSVVIHKTNSNVGSNIAIDNKESLSRYNYAYRNECVVARENGIKGRARQFAKVNYNILKVLIKSKDVKLKRIKIIINSSIKGIRFKPEIEYL